MKVTVNLINIDYQVHIEQALSLAIPVDFLQGHKQPNHFGATPASAKPMIAGGFIGNTKQGGSCNVNELSINPHCSGTHTETIGHICHFGSAQVASIADIKLPALMPCVVITVTPVSSKDTQDSYTPAFEAQDNVIHRHQLEQQIGIYNDKQLKCLAIRTLPNSTSKLNERYHHENQPPFFTREAIQYLNERHVDHLIVDIPSLDRLDDDGLLSCHHIFWQVDEGSHQANINSLANKTITELAYIPEKIIDGFYFVNLQTPAFENDAAPSRPVLYPVTVLNKHHE